MCFVLCVIKQAYCTSALCSLKCASYRLHIIYLFYMTCIDVINLYFVLHENFLCRFVYCVYVVLHVYLFYFAIIVCFMFLGIKIPKAARP